MKSLSLLLCLQELSTEPCLQPAEFSLCPHIGLLLKIYYNVILSLHQCIQIGDFLSTFPTLNTMYSTLFHCVLSAQQIISLGSDCPVGSRFLTCPYRPARLWGPTNLLSNGYCALFPPGVKRQECKANNSPLTSA
jgi:hypothetical protein